MAGEGISIDKKDGEEKIEIKAINQGESGVDPNAALVYGNLDIKVSKTIGAGVKIDYAGNINRYDIAGTTTASYILPANEQANNLLSDKNTKTLFGDKSIYGVGNIDLYRHNIKITDSTDSKFVCYLMIYSSRNIIVDSLTDLKTLIGYTFEYPATGTATYNNVAYTIYAVNQTNFLVMGTNYTFNWTNKTLTDKVTTI